ncbi:hypothetical protein MKW92_006053 [Papaver armeniacum]|nr:hypothetical protein MKW92_006053 [Papaver armeniacum]
MATPSIITTAGLMFLLLLAPAVFAVDYPVSWTLGTSYEDWDSDKTLFPGDTITFSYGPSHSLSVVKKDKMRQLWGRCHKVFQRWKEHCSFGSRNHFAMRGLRKNHTSPPPADAPSPVAPELARGTGAATSNYNLNFMVIGGSLLLAPLFAFLG